MSPQESKLIDIDEIIDSYPGRPEYLIFLLQDIQAAFNYISPEALALVCDHTGVPLSRAYSVATFYKSFSLEPRGEHEIKVCDGTACHLRRSELLVEHLERRLGVPAGGTTKDLRLTLDTISCPGCCASSPVVMLDEDYYPKFTTRQLDELLKDLEAD